MFTKLFKPLLITLTLLTAHNSYPTAHTTLPIPGSQKLGLNINVSGLKKRAPRGFFASLWRAIPIKQFLVVGIVGAACYGIYDYFLNDGKRTRALITETTQSIKDLITKSHNALRDLIEKRHDDLKKHISTENKQTRTELAQTETRLAQQINDLRALIEQRQQ